MEEYREQDGRIVDSELAGLLGREVASPDDKLGELFTRLVTNRVLMVLNV
jgi:hypothetical protein